MKIKIITTASNLGDGGLLDQETRDFLVGLELETTDKMSDSWFRFCDYSGVTNEDNFDDYYFIDCNVLINALKECGYITKANRLNHFMNYHRLTTFHYPKSLCEITNA